MRLPSEDGYDIVLIVTRNNLRGSETIARRLVDIPYELVASPEWFDKYGQIEDIQQLENVGEMIRHEYDAALQVTQEALREPRGKLRLAAPSALMVRRQCW